MIIYQSATDFHIQVHVIFGTDDIRESYFGWKSENSKNQKSKIYIRHRWSPRLCYSRFYHLHSEKRMQRVVQMAGFVCVWEETESTLLIEHLVHAYSYKCPDLLSRYSHTCIRSSVMADDICPAAYKYVLYSTGFACHIGLLLLLPPRCQSPSQIHEACQMEMARDSCYTWWQPCLAHPSQWRNNCAPTELCSLSVMRRCPMHKVKGAVETSGQMSESGSRRGVPGLHGKITCTELVLYLWTIP